jgi:3-phosphoshikimate 1-carboxyvinyltransferase
MVSYPYLKISLFLLEHFGINIQEKKKENGLLTYQIENSQKYRAQEIEIPSDFSATAFMIAAGILTPKNSMIKLRNININDPQGDKQMLDIVKRMGAKIQIIKEKNEIVIHGNIKKNPLKGIEIDCSNIPDLFPILCVIGSFAKGKTILKNIKTIRLKESERVSIMTRELTKMGAKIKEKENEIIIHHTQILYGANIEHENDHRIAMACTIATLFADSKSTIPNINIVEDSYPNFIQDLLNLGAKIKLKEN